MDMTIFTDVPFGNRDAFDDFLFANSQAHHDIAAKLEQSGKAIDSFPLTEVGDPKDWLAVHNDMHQQEFNSLGLTGLPDLSEFDLADRKQYDDFMYLHAAAHQTVNNALGLA